jgi:hypothetical protein
MTHPSLEMRDFSHYDQLHSHRKNIKHLNYEDLVKVAFRMRKEDYEEIYLGSGYANPLVLAEHIYKTALFGSIFYDKGTPKGVMSFHATIPGVWNVGFFATDDWGSIFTSASIYAKKLVNKAVTSKLVRRVEARSLYSYTQAHKWLEWLGAKKECELKDWGLGGQTYYLYCWKISDYSPETL